jgi:hypothetical protein
MLGVRGLPPLLILVVKTEYFSQAWVNKLPFFSDVFPKDEFRLFFWNLHFEHS